MKTITSWWRQLWLQIGVPKRHRVHIIVVNRKYKIYRNGVWQKCHNIALCTHCMLTCNKNCSCPCQWCGLRPKNLSWSCSCRSGVVSWNTVLSRLISDFEGHNNFSITIYSFSILCLEHHYSGDQQLRSLTCLKVKSAKCLCLLPVVLILLFWSLVLRIWSCLHHWSLLLQWTVYCTVDRSPTR